jgi:hypothetical protein
MKTIKKGAMAVRASLEHPGRILFYCLGFFIMTLLLNGVPLRLWGLYRDLERYQLEIEQTQLALRDLGLKLNQASDPVYIEQQARDRLDLAGDDDLIFVFPNQ